MKYLPTNIPDLEEPCPIFLLTKATEINKGPTIDVSKLSPELMLQICSAFFGI